MNLRRLAAMVLPPLVPLVLVLALWETAVRLGDVPQPWVRKYAPDGTERWTWYASVYGHAAGVAADSQGNGVVTGLGADDILVAKIAP